MVIFSFGEKKVDKKKEKKDQDGISFIIAQIAGAGLALWFFFDVKSAGALSTVLYLTLAVMLGKLIINNGVALAIRLADSIAESEMGESFSEKALRKITEAAEKKVGETSDLQDKTIEELRARLDELQKIEEKQKAQQKAS